MKAFPYFSTVNSPLNFVQAFHIYHVYFNSWFIYYGVNYNSVSHISEMIKMLCTVNGTVLTFRGGTTEIGNKSW